MPNIVTFDPSGPLRIIEISIGGDNALTWQEIYSEWKIWAAIGDNMKYPPAFSEVGGNPTVGSDALGVTLFLLKPWRLRPAEFSHRLKIDGNCYLGVRSETGDVSGVSESPIVATLDAYTVLVETKVSNLTDSRLMELPAIQRSSYDGAVNIDIDNLTEHAISGTAYPAGNTSSPSNNLADAILIEEELRFGLFRIIGNVIIDGYMYYNVENKMFHGRHWTMDSIILDSTALTQGCMFQDLTVEGILDGMNALYHCRINNLEYVEGDIQQCMLAGNIVLAGTEDTNFVNCEDGLPGLGTPEIDLGGSGRNLGIWGYNGGIKLKNKTGSEKVSVNLTTGRVILDTATITGGDIIIRGVGTVEGGVSGTATLDVSGLINPAVIETTLASVHGAGSWETGDSAPTVDQIKAGILGEVVPGSYGDGTVGKKIGTNLDANISSRAAPGAAMTLTSGERVEIDTQLSSQHGADSWEAAAVWDESSSSHIGAGSVGKLLSDMFNNTLQTLKIESGKWKIADNKMIFYDDDNTTPLLTFNLKKKDGTPTEIDVFEREPI